MTTKRLSKYRNNSVLKNLDTFDKRSFETILDKSEALKNVNKQGEKSLFSFEPLLNDLWGSLYKAKPELADVHNIDSNLLLNHQLLERMMNEQSFQDYREYTKLDDLTSAMATVKVGEQTNEWLLQQQKENEKAKELINQIKQQQKKQQSKQENSNGSPNNESQANSPLPDLMNQLMNELGFESLTMGLDKSLDEAKQDSDNVKQLLAGNDPAQLKKIPLGEKIKLAEKLRHNQKLRNIAEWAGRFQSIARKKQKSKQAKNIDRSGVTLGNDIEKLLPSELALYHNQATKMDFLRRFSEGEVLLYDNKGKEELSKGPIILCLDQSSSMKSLDTMSKAFTIAIMSIARQQKRDFAYIPFSSTSGIVQKFAKGKITTNELVTICEVFMGGGTNFISPLSKSLELINESRFNKADVIFITDGEASLSEDFLQRFNEVKRKKDFQVLSLCLKHRTDGLESFSDKVESIKNFQDEKSFSAFEI